jgi:hypothetical protein
MVLEPQTLNPKPQTSVELLGWCWSADFRATPAGADAVKVRLASHAEMKIQRIKMRGKRKRERRRESKRVRE